MAMVKISTKIISNMKKYLNIIVVIISFIFVLLSFNYNSSSYISNKSWKYSGGFSCGDIIQFEVEKGVNRKLKMKGIESADVAFCFYKYLIVKNKESREYGYYELKRGFK